MITKNEADWAACAVKPRARKDWQWDWEGVGGSQKGEIKYARKALRKAHPGRTEAQYEAMIVHASVAEYRAFKVRAMLGAPHDFKQGDALD